MLLQEQIALLSDQLKAQVLSFLVVVVAYGIIIIKQHISRRVDKRAVQSVEEKQETLEQNQVSVAEDRERILNQFTKDCLDRTNTLSEANWKLHEQMVITEQSHEGDRARWLLERGNLLEQINSLSVDLRTCTALSESQASAIEQMTDERLLARRVVDRGHSSG